MIEKENLINFKTTINCRGKIIDLSQPKVMGILNLTPDSFYDGGALKTDLEALKQLEKMLSEGADFIDIGAQSTKPNATLLSSKDEILRLKSILGIVKRNFPETILSLDTFQSEVAKFGINEFGIDIINDVSGGELDSEMFPLIAKCNLPYIIMHMRGNPQNMQEFINYNDIVVDIIEYFAHKIEKAKLLGINDIILDPGFGFSKTVEQNYELLKRLSEFNIIGLPILVGLSRKSMINRVLDTTPANALNGTSVLNTMALLGGAKILRVHDVKEATEVVKIMKMLAN
jgi:dihydropteroate synthase